MIHATRIEAENRERDPSPMLTLGEEPCEHCVNDGEHDHRTEESKHVGETNGADERHDAGSARHRSRFLGNFQCLNVCRS